MLQLKRQQHYIEVGDPGHLWKKKEPVKKKASGREDWSGGESRIESMEARGNYSGSLIHCGTSV